MDRVHASLIAHGLDELRIGHDLRAERNGTPLLARESIVDPRGLCNAFGNLFHTQSSGLTELLEDLPGGLRVDEIVEIQEGLFRRLDVIALLEILQLQHGRRQRVLAAVAIAEIRVVVHGAHDLRRGH